MEGPDLYDATGRVTFCLGCAETNEEAQTSIDRRAAP